MKKALLLLGGIVLLFLTSCELIKSKDNDDGLNLETTKLSTVKLEKEKENEKPIFSAYSRVINENNDGFYKVYYFNLGTVKGVPIVTAETHEYSGVKTTVTYTISKASEQGIEEAIESTVSASTISTFQEGKSIVRGAQDTNTHTYDYSIEEGKSTSITGGIEEEISILKGLKISPSLSTTSENSIVNTHNWGEEFSKTKSVEAANSYDKSMTTSKDKSFTNAYSTYSNSVYTETKEFSFELDNIENGYYRYGLFALCEVYSILVIDTADNVAYMQYNLYPIKDKFYYGIQYSKDMNFEDELSQKYTIDLDDIVDYLNYDADNSIEIQGFTVEFNVDGGSSIESQIITPGNKAIKPSNPIKEGYVFGGWYKESTLVNKYNFNDYVSTNTTIYAKWYDKENELYEITFNSNGGNDISSQFVSIGDKIAYPIEPIKEGYTFDGWCIDPTLNVMFNFDDCINKSMTLYAKWKIGEYKVTFDNENGNVKIDGNNSKFVEYNSVYGYLPDASKIGYTFKGWSTSKTDEVIVLEYDKVKIAKNHILYPIFTQNQYTISFVEITDGIKKSILPSKTIYFGETMILPTPTHQYSKYYNFKGWEINGSIYNEEYTFTIAGNIEFLATWDQVFNDYTYILTANDFKYHIGNNLGKYDKPTNCGAGNYMLINDIDLGEWNDGNGYTYWASNNTSTTLNGKTRFSGVFDGQNHTIKYKLRIGKTSLASWAVGLFPVTDGAKIMNLKVNADLRTYDPQGRNQKWDISNDDRAEDVMVGGIVGYSKDTTILNCSVSGTVHYNSDGGAGDTCVAGVVGYAYNSTVNNCSSSATIYARGFYVNVAGIIACYYGSSYDSLDFFGNISYNEDWAFGGSWMNNLVAKKLKVL